MEQSLWQKLQRVKGKDLWHIILFLCALPVSMVFRSFHKGMWLICDAENEARDNGYWLFRYIVENHPEQEAVYAINKRSPDFDRVKGLGKVIQFGSFQHWLYYLSAEKNISSQKSGKPNAAVCYFLEVYGLYKNTRVFLQHGITKDDMEFLYYKHTKMRLFVCAVEDEYEYVKSRFGYPEGWVQNLGFCRFDNLFDTSSGRRQILVMPTWRNWIGITTSKSYQYENVDDFTSTEYYKNWYGFLKSPQLYRLLEEYNAQLVFYPHREMQKYAGHFSIGHPSVTIAKWPEHDVQELLKSSSFLITDYSSIAMDFAYMKKPLAYFQFDYGMYRKGHYPEGYFCYEEDGFGKVCKTLDALLDELESVLDRGFTMETSYRERAEKFYQIFDKKNCERNFLAIQRIPCHRR